MDTMTNNNSSDRTPEEAAGYPAGSTQREIVKPDVRTINMFRHVAQVAVKTGRRRHAEVIH